MVEIWTENEKEYLFSMPDTDNPEFYKLAVIVYEQGFKAGFTEGKEYGLKEWSNMVDSVNHAIKKIMKDKQGGENIFYE